MKIKKSELENLLESLCAEIRQGQNFLALSTIKKFEDIYGLNQREYSEEERREISLQNIALMKKSLGIGV